MDVYDPNTVFCSIDHGGRYAALVKMLDEALAGTRATRQPLARRIPIELERSRS